MGTTTKAKLILAGLALAYAAGAGSGAWAVLAHGDAIGRRLFAVGAWVANAHAGAAWEVAVEPNLTLAAAPAQKAVDKNAGRR